MTPVAQAAGVFLCDFVKMTAKSDDNAENSKKFLRFFG